MFFGCNSSHADGRVGSSSAAPESVPRSSVDRRRPERTRQVNPSHVPTGGSDPPVGTCDGLTCSSFRNETGPDGKNSTTCIISDPGIFLDQPACDLTWDKGSIVLQDAQLQGQFRDETKLSLSATAGNITVRNAYLWRFRSLTLKASGPVEFLYEEGTDDRRWSAALRLRQEEHHPVGQEEMLLGAGRFFRAEGTSKAAQPEESHSRIRESFRGFSSSPILSVGLLDIQADKIFVNGTASFEWRQVGDVDFRANGTIDLLAGSFDVKNIFRLSAKGAVTLANKASVTCSGRVEIISEKAAELRGIVSEAGTYIAPHWPWSGGSQTPDLTVSAPVVTLSPADTWNLAKVFVFAATSISLFSTMPDFDVDIRTAGVNRCTKVGLCKYIEFEMVFFGIMDEECWRA